MTIKRINREVIIKKGEERINATNNESKEVVVEHKDRPSLFREGEQFEVDDLYVYKIDDNGKKINISNYMGLESITWNIDTNECKGVIKYRFFNKDMKIEVNRQNYINKNKLIDLIKDGLDITHRNINDLVDYFRESEEKFESPSYIHSNIGFSEFKDKTIYKLNKAIGIESTYVGNYELEPKGRKEEYEYMLKKEVYGKTELELIIAVALSAVIIGYIGEEMALDTNIFHLVGNSTTGKSTALRLGISLFAFPDNRKSSLYSTYNGTNNAIIKRMTGIKGVPFALDEVSMGTTNNFSRFVYIAANGVDKQRLNKDSELKESGTWLTTILSNGEKSLIDSSNKNAGIKVRVIEAKNISWTKDAENSNNINKVILQNYGYIGIEFAEYVMKMGKEEVKNDFYTVQKFVYEKIKEKILVDKMTERRCTKFASIILAAYYYEDMKDIELDIDGMIDILANIEKESIRERNFSTSAIDYIKQYISKFKRKFETKDNTPIDTLGKLIPKREWIEVQMNKISFEEMIKQGGYEDKNVVLRELKQNGYLNCESDRFTRSRKSPVGYTQEVYVIKLPKEQIIDEEEDFEEVII